MNDSLPPLRLTVPLKQPTREAHVDEWRAYAQSQGGTLLSIGERVWFQYTECRGIANCETAPADARKSMATQAEELLDLALRIDAALAEEADAA